MAGTDLRPGQWPARCVQGDVFPVETVEVVVERGGVEFPVSVTAAVAQVRCRRDRSSGLILDLDATFAGSSVSWGGVAVPVLPGLWAWDLQVTGTVDGDVFNLTVLEGAFSIGTDVSHV